MEKKYLYNSEQYIQNRTNWCWAVACRMVGEQFKRNNPAYDFEIIYDKDTASESAVRVDDINSLRLAMLEGIRTDVVRKKDGMFWLDTWQRLIVMNANSDYPGLDGNWPGDDEAKERGIKYVITGHCDSHLVKVVSIGVYASKESILHYHYKQIRLAFAQNNYLIGNAILYPNGVCHSFVLLDWTAEDKILLYDPWDGHFRFHAAADVFCNGISVPLGTGIIKWAQYVL